MRLLADFMSGFVSLRPSPEQRQLAGNRIGSCFRSKASMKSKTDILLIILILMLVGQGCAGRASYQFLNQSARPAESRRFFDELDGAVYLSGNHNGAYFEVTGFPYLRANRCQN